MNYRFLGGTGLKVSEIGYGAWGIGKMQWIGATDEESLRALNRSIDLGLNFIDTALAYGEGHSEVLVGQALKGRKETIYVATKVPPKNLIWPAGKNTPVREVFPAKHVIDCTERSLKNLQIDAIDVQQLHVWDDNFLGQGDWLEAAEKLKKQGKIRFFGVSIGEPARSLKLFETGLADTVQVVYNIFHQSPEDELFAVCRRRKIGVIARVPLDEGGLTGKITPDTRFEKGEFREMYFSGDRRRQVFERVNRITADLGVTNDRMPETAIRFVLSHPDVSTVIPGMRTAKHAESNCAMGDGRGLPKEQVEKLRKHRWNCDSN